MTESLNLDISGVESHAVSTFDFSNLEQNWRHPYLSQNQERIYLSKFELRKFAYEYYLKFLPFFRNQPEGCIETQVRIDVSRRLKSKLGLAYLFEKKIILNEDYFAQDPKWLPYTLFHEMVHVWLYSCYLDPGHTSRFYRKMAEFKSTGLPIDSEMHIHDRLNPESNFVYCCPNCGNRWYLREVISYSIFCGQCYDSDGVEHFAKLR